MRVKFIKLYSTLLLLVLSPLVYSQIAAGVETPEEIVVVGRQPGPPLWRVYNDDKVLWIFPYLETVPKDMIWESDKVAVVIAGSQESLSMPDISASASPLLLLNPINIFRGMRLAKRMIRNPDDATLEEVLPPELFARFAALQTQYFPRNDDFEEVRPLVAGVRMTALIQKKEGLVSGGDIMKTIRRLIRRNKDIERTEIEVKMDLEGSFSTLAERAENLMASLSREQELACFEDRVRRMESDLDDMKLRANTWAQGYVDEFRDVPLVGDAADACVNLIAGSSEQELVVELQSRAEELWLANAERALANNQSTFAILPINDLLSDDGLLSKLKAKGYEIREP